MPFLNEQVEIINKAIRSRGLSDARFQSGDFNALADQIVENRKSNGDKRYPVVYRKSKPFNIGLDDKFPIIIYHRQRNSRFLEPDNGFGSGKNVYKEQTDMHLVVFGSRKKLELRPEELSALITLSMPTQVSKTELADMNIDTMLVSLSNTNMDSLSVFREEYSGIDYKVSPDHVLFKIIYTITTQYRKDCLNLCDCNPQ